jgi:hypothetical protein
MKLRQSPTGRAGTRRLATAVIAAGLVVAACSTRGVDARGDVGRNCACERSD